MAMQGHMGYRDLRIRVWGPGLEAQGFERYLSLLELREMQILP